MEEKKNGKTVALNAAVEKARGNKEEQKLTYEQLNNVCQNLYLENQKLLQQVQQLNMTNAFRRLDYLFKVVENADIIKDADFIGTCIDEIKEAMIVHEPEEEEKEV